VYHKKVRGRNTKHCSLYTVDEFQNRFILWGMCIFSFLYVAYFLKIYILNPLGYDKITYTTLCPISAGPAILAYMFEMFRECFRHSRNWAAKGNHLEIMCTEKTEAYAHNMSTASKKEYVKTVG
jgi:hypothetical protein